MAGASWHASLSSSFVHDTCTVQSPACRAPRRAFVHNATAMDQRKLAVLASAVQEASSMTPYQEDRMDNCQLATHRPLRCSRVRRASMSPAYLRLAVHPSPASPCPQTCRVCWLRRVDEMITRTFPVNFQLSRKKVCSFFGSPVASKTGGCRGGGQKGGRL